MPVFSLNPLATARSPALLPLPTEEAVVAGSFKLVDEFSWNPVEAVVCAVDVPLNKYEF